jgi:hypothetical protein
MRTSRATPGRDRAALERLVDKAAQTAVLRIVVAEHVQRQRGKQDTGANTELPAEDDQCSGLEGRTKADLMSEFCRDLPLSVICAMLGLPEQDHDRFKNWLGGLKDTANTGAVIRAIPGVISVVRYLRRVSGPGGWRQQGEEPA